MQQRDWSLKRVRRTNKEIEWSTYRRSRNAVNNKVHLAKADYNGNLIKKLMRENFSGEL